MKQLIYCTFISLAFFSCTDSDSPEKKQEVPTKETPKTEADKGDEVVSKPVDSLKRNPVVYDLTASQVKKLAKLLPEQTVKKIVNYMTDWAAVKTDIEFARVYHNGKSLFETIETDIYTKFPDDAYNAMEAMRFIDKSFALRSSCEAECSEFVMNYNYVDLATLAAFTKGKADDDFVKLKIMAEGDQARYDPSWLNFFERTWDYGGGSLLGDGNNFAFLEASFQVIQKSDLFKRDLLKLRGKVIEDMKHRIYMHPKTAVMAELDQILKAKCLSYDEAHQILELRQRIERDNEDPALQFNCSDPEQNCDWGG
ncbi:hypothetical protein D3C71_1324250 [compost metagenome]